MTQQTSRFSAPLAELQADIAAGIMDGYRRGKIDCLESLKQAALIDNEIADDLIAMIRDQP